MKVKSLPQLLVGGAIIFLGVGFLLNALGAWQFSSFISQWWPVLIIVVGLASLLTNPSSPLWPLFVMAAGFLLLLKTTGAIHFGVWQVIWPVAIIMFGLSFFFHQVVPQPKTLEHNESDIFVIFSGVDSVNKSHNYTGGKINAIFGGVKLDLREAVIKDKATLEVFAAFGGAELRVPENWIVHTSGLPLFGGWEDKTRKPSDDQAPVLEIHGTCLFGGVEIKN